MSGYGLVTVRSDGQVLMKIMSNGFGGSNHVTYAAELKSLWPVSIGRGHLMARQMGFGDTSSLMAVTATERCYVGAIHFSTNFNQSFNDPEFVPGWSPNKSKNISIIDV